ncbi:MAG TPA: substrate-binding domain-containing protein, partial [Armatimonadota bacterium]|nr:substrate-binding domain-containing protein [Armatimonadota bacterium]
MRRMAVLVVALALALAIGAAGCSKPQQEGTPAGPSATQTKMPTDTGKKGTAANPWVIGMSQCNLGEPWRIRMNDDIKKADEATPQVTVQFKDAQGKEDQQQAQVQEFIDAKVDLLIISPKEAIPLTAPVEKAMDAGIPVIVLDRKIASDKYTCFIGADNTAIGREAGKYLVKLLGGQG